MLMIIHGLSPLWWQQQVQGNSRWNNCLFVANIYTHTHTHRNTQTNYRKIRTSKITKSIWELTQEYTEVETVLMQKCTHIHTHILVNLRSLWAVASEVYGCRHCYHQPRNRVATQVEILPPGVTSLEYLPLQQVQFHSLQTQPAKHWEQREVQQAGNDGAHNL